MFEFFKDLSESRLFPNVATLEKRTDTELEEWTLLNLCALRILLAVEHSHDWARVYARKTAQFGKFDKWRIDGNDLYELLQSMNTVNSGKPKIGAGLNTSNVLMWLRDAAKHEPDEYLTRRLFVRLDYDLHIHNPSLRAIRRLTMDFHHIDREKKQLLVTRILQYFRLKMRKSELLIQLERVARHHDLILHKDEESGIIPRPY